MSHWEEIQYPSTWLYAHSASDGWEVVDIDGEPTVIPSLTKYPIVAGVNGTTVRWIKDKQGNGRWALQMGHAVANAATRGLQLLQGPIEKEYRNGKYLAFGEVKRRGKRVRFVPDRDAEYRWRASLVDRGIIQPPDPDFLDHLVDACRRRISRHSQRAHTPYGAKQIEQAERDLARTEAALAKLSNPPTEPKRKRGAA